jgi:hypothetical protein
MFGYASVMKAELEQFLSEGKQTARQAIWQGIFLLPAIILWVLGFDISLEFLLVAGAICYLVLPAIFAIILRKVKSPQERAIEVLQQTVDDLNERIEIDNTYFSVLAALSEAEGQQNAFIDWKLRGEESSPMPQGTQHTLDRLVRAVTELRLQISRFLAQRTGVTVAPAPLNELEVGDVEGLRQLRSTLHDDITRFRSTR